MHISVNLLYLLYLLTHNDVAVVLSGEQVEANLIAHVSAGRLMTLNRECRNDSFTTAIRREGLHAQ